MKVCSYLSLLFAMIIFIGCGNSSDPKSPSKLSAKSRTIVTQIKELQLLVNQDLILRSVTPNELANLNQSLIQIETLIRRLDNVPDDRYALNGLIELYKEFKSFPFTDIDRSYFLSLNDKIGSVIVIYADFQGVIIDDLNRYKTFYKDDFTEGINPKWSQFTEFGDDRLEFVAKNFQDRHYLRISSFVNNGDNYAGVKRLISKQVQLDPRALTQIEIAQAFNFYPQEHHSKQFIKVQVREVGEDWIDLNFTNLPQGNSFDVFKTGFVNLPNELQGKNVEFSFRYESTPNINPLWDIHSLELRADYVR